MPFNLLLLPLLGGFVFIRLWNRTRWYTVQADKERLLLYASLAGLAFLCVSFFIISIPPFIPCHPTFCLPTWWKDHVKFEHSGVSFLSLFLGVTSWKLLNCFWNEKKEAKRILVEQGGIFEQLVERAMSNSRTVLITLKSGKVYVGFVISSIEPGSKEKNIHILPTKSGYRESDKHRVVFTTNYARVYQEINKDKAINNGKLMTILAQLEEQEETHNKDKETLEQQAQLLKKDLLMLTESEKLFGVILPISDINTMTIYIPDIHERYFPHAEHLENNEQP